MKNYKTILILSLTFNLTSLIGSFSSADIVDQRRASMNVRVGKTDSEREAILADNRHERECEKYLLEQTSTVQGFISKCSNGFIDSLGCSINIEKACVNGEEVQLSYRPQQILSLLGEFGFDAHYSRGISKYDLKPGQSEDSLYKPVKLNPNSPPVQLCNKVPLSGGLTANKLVEQDLPNGSYKIVSTPAVLKPDEKMVGKTIHWEIEVTPGPNGVPNRILTMSMQDTEIPGKTMVSQDNGFKYEKKKEISMRLWMSCCSKIWLGVKRARPLLI